MRRILTALLCCAVAALLLAGCAKLQENAGQNPVSPQSLVHPPGWGDSSNATAFHGTYLKKQDWNTTQCQSCHGGTYGGGSSTVSCFTCHDPFPHEVKFALNTGRHPGYLKAHGFNLPSCQPCHGAGYTGGRVDVSCEQSGCHATTAGAPKSPEACNTCHGQFRGDPADTLTWAPPRALNGDTLATAHGVGAHQFHLRGAGNYSALAVPCNTCHVVPSNIYAPGHLDMQNGAEVNLSGLAVLPSADGTPNAAYDAATQRCNNTYCHGKWTLSKSTSPWPFVYADSTIQGAAFSPTWTGGNAEATCGTCHGLPPAGHTDFGQPCSACHTNAFDASGHLDKTKHMNGKVDVFNQELDFH